MVANGLTTEVHSGSLRETKQHDFYLSVMDRDVIDERKNTWKYTSFYYVKYIPSIALTSSKGRADYRALLRLTKSFSRQHIKVSPHKGEHLFFCYPGPRD